jgi:hypothetical protein
MGNAKKTGRAPRSCRECKRWPSIRERVRVGESLAKVITRMEAEINKEGFKTTIADYLKLVQLEKEFESNESKEIRVKWVEPAEQTDSEKSE